MHLQQKKTEKKHTPHTSDGKKIETISSFPFLPIPNNPTTDDDDDDDYETTGQKNSFSRIVTKHQQTLDTFGLWKLSGRFPPTKQKGRGIKRKTYFL